MKLVVYSRFVKRRSIQINNGQKNESRHPTLLNNSDLASTVWSDKSKIKIIGYSRFNLLSGKLQREEINIF